MKKLLIPLLTLFGFAATAQSPFTGAHWISPVADTNGIAPVFQKSFMLHKPVKKATLYITAHGLYEAILNGKRIGNRYFTPGFTPYDKELFYNTYDVTKLLANKRNTLLAMIGDGWYRGVFGPHGDQSGRPNVWGKDASLLAKLKITYTDGSQESVQTDATWRCGKGPLIHNAGIYFGETWNENVSFHGWQPVKTGATVQKNIVPYPMEPVIKQEVFKPRRIFKDHLGNTIIDFGQNMAGWVQLHIQGKKGDTIKVHHFETLDVYGNYFTADLLHADPTDIYILNGKGLETLEPHFTYHGFRYAKVEGFIPTTTNCMAIAVHTNLKHTGTFSCSDPLINRLQKNIEWSLNSNFLEIPTDCPQRGERMGWTGDAQIFFRTAAYNRDVRMFFSKWLHDLSLEQGANGGVPKVIPDSYQPGETGTNKFIIGGWGDASVIIPMDYYRAYGDTALLRRQYPGMNAWVKAEISRIDPKDGLWKDGTYGDSYCVGPETSEIYLDQSFLIHSIKLLLEAQDILQITNEKTAFTEALQNAQAAWNKTFLTSDTLNQQTQTACVLALHFNLAKNKPKIAKQLVDMIHQNHDHLATGFLGTPYLLQELTKNGYNRLAYTLLEQKTMPSWLYEIEQGATTIWEKWNPYKDGNYDLYSLNHYANGAVGCWLFETVGGISPLAPGFKKILIAPQPGGHLTWAKATYQSVHGLIVSSWKRQGPILLTHVVIPKGATAIVRLPNQPDKNLKSGTYHFKSAI